MCVRSGLTGCQIHTFTDTSSKEVITDTATMFKNTIPAEQMASWKYYLENVFTAFNGAIPALPYHHRGTAPILYMCLVNMEF